MFFLSCVFKMIEWSGKWFNEKQDQLPLPIASAESEIREQKSEVSVGAHQPACLEKAIRVALFLEAEYVAVITAFSDANS
jgi:hypothetical protein